MSPEEIPTSFSSAQFPQSQLTRRANCGWTSAHWSSGSVSSTQCRYESGPVSWKDSGPARTLRHSFCRLRVGSTSSWTWTWNKIKSDWIYKSEAAAGWGGGGGGGQVWCISRSWCLLGEGAVLSGSDFCHSYYRESGGGGVSGVALGVEVFGGSVGGGDNMGCPSPTEQLGQEKDGGWLGGGHCRLREEEVSVWGGNSTLSPKSPRTSWLKRFLFWYKICGFWFSSSPNPISHEPLKDHSHEQRVQYCDTSSSSSFSSSSFHSVSIFCY